MWIALCVVALPFALGIIIGAVQSVYDGRDPGRIATLKRKLEASRKWGLFR